MSDSLRWRLLSACLCGGLGLACAAQAAPREPSLNDLLDRATQHYDHGDYDVARREFEQATKKDPGSARAWRGLGWTLWQSGEQDRAQKIWSDLLKVWPNDPDTLLALAQAHESRNQWDAALNLYNKVLASKPDTLSALLGRARINQRYERWSAAESDLYKVLSRSPRDFGAQFMLAEIYKSSGREKQATALFRRLAQQGPDPRHWRPMADALMQLGQPQDAIAYYERALQREPGNRGTMLGLARAYAQVHRYQPSIRLLERWLAQHPRDSDVRGEIARYATGTGDFDKAIRYYRTLVREQPGEMKWPVALARTLQYAGETDQTAEAARRILERDPNNVDALEMLADDAMFRGGYQAAIPWLERLAAADPSAKRYNNLGDKLTSLGDEDTLKDDTAAAHAAYARAAEAFQRASEIEPQNADALLGLATALRLSSDYKQALQAAQKVLKQYPSVLRAQKEVYEDKLGLKDYAGAEAAIRAGLKFDPANLRLEQDLLRVRFIEGKRKQAIADARELLEQPIDPSVPVLLYHGVNLTKTRQDAMPVENFRDQLKALKEAGYQSITLQQLFDFYANDAPLPADKVVAITFDDARADTFRYADQVLAEFGFTATMFTPVGEIGRHGPYYADWGTIRAARDSGRWDIQCHSNLGHAPIPIDAQGDKGLFLTSRMWLTDKRRVETREEFLERVEGDYRRCGEILQEHLPNQQLLGYAFPFGELGQKTLSNEPDAIEINKAFAVKYFRIGFVEDPAAPVTRTSSPAVLPRFEVPRDFSGRDLLERVRAGNARTSTQMALAELYAWDGQYAQANTILDEVAKSESVDRAQLLTMRGRMRMWEGDFADARRYLELAALETENKPGAYKPTQESLEQLRTRTAPSLAGEFDSYSDNRDRRNTGYGGNFKFYAADRNIFTLGYRRRRFEQNQFDASQLTTPPGTTPQPVDLLAEGNEFAGEWAYRWNWRTQIAVAGGVLQIDKAESQGVFGKPNAQGFGTLAVDLPLGSSADLALRGKRELVATAGAVLDHLGATGGEARLKLAPAEGAVQLDFGYTGLAYDGGNKRNTVIGDVLFRLVKAPLLQLGYRFTYDSTAKRSPLFYTPDGYTGHDGVLKLSTPVGKPVTFGLELAAGVGYERGGTPRAEASALGNLRLNLGDHFSVYANGGRSQAANFRSSQANAGLEILF